MPSVILATAGYDQTIKFWEASTGVCYRTLKCADNMVRTLVGMLERQAVCVGEGRVRWLPEGVLTFGAVRARARVQQVNCLRIAPGKQHIAAASNPLIRLYDISSKSSEPVRTRVGGSLCSAVP